MTEQMIAQQAWYVKSKVMRVETFILLEPTSAVALRDHVLEARLQERCLLFRQNRPLKHLLKNLVAPHTATFQRIGLRTGCNGRS